MESIKKCIILINNLSGGIKFVKADDLVLAFGDGFATEIFYIEKNKPFEYTKCNRIVVCGGDGTLNRTINMYRDSGTEIIYCPFGTLNEASKRDVKHNGEFVISDGGEADGKYFSYVLATGTFTPLGYAVDVKMKQKIRILAYILNVVKQLKVWRVSATLNADGQKYTGQYSLIMAIHSPQCFGLTFNKMFVPNDGKMYLLTVKAPKFNRLFGLIEMFFPFFRAFFIGFKKPYQSKRMAFKEVKSLDITTDKNYNFCVDGENWVMPTEFNVRPIVLSPCVKVVTGQKIQEIINAKNR